MNIFICNTPYQIIVSLQVCMTINSMEDRIIIVTDLVNGSEKVVKELIETGYFSRTLHVNVRGRKWNERDFHIPVMKKRLIRYLDTIIGSEFKEKLIGSNNRIFVANLSGFPIIFANYIEELSSDFEFHIIEDGLSSYSRIYKQGIDYRLSNKNILKRIEFKLVPSIISRTKKYHLFYPELLVWEPPFEIAVIPSIDESNEDLKAILNRAFGYGQLRDKYTEKVVFFEESYAEDGIPVNDVEIVQRLIEKFGNEEIFIKRHPRVTKNRFEELKVKCNSDTTIPWEVIVINKDINDKYLITMTSTAVVNSILLIGSNIHAVFAFEKLQKIDNDRIRHSVEVIKKLMSLYPSKISTLESITK